MDIEGKLVDYLPESAFGAVDGASNGSEAKSGASGWTPPGELVHTYESDGRTFQIWRSTLVDERALEILSNMRILVPFFIEGGTIGFVDEPAWSLERWKLFLLYEVTSSSKSSSSYTLAGFSTSYRLWVFPTDEITRNSSVNVSDEPFDPEQTTIPAPISPLNLLSRERISQFIVLPPFQGQSHGSQLYNAMVSYFRADPLVFEITVEEPNESFDVLRDMNDMAYLVSQTTSQDPSFTSLALPVQVPAAELKRTSYIPDLLSTSDLNTLRARAKLAPRQFQRLVEIHTLSTIPKAHRNVHRITRKAASADANDRRYYFWRLMVKERLFIRNKDQLVQLEEEERVPKLEEIMPGVVDEYESRIEGFERRVDDYGLLAVVEAFYGSAQGKKQNKVVPKKRKVIEDDDDEETEDSGVETKKRMRAAGRMKKVLPPTSDAEEEEGPNTLHA